jgi:hypothetical protein
VSGPSPKVYDQDSEDLLRWLLKQHARKLLMKVEERDKKQRVYYDEPMTLTVKAPSPDPRKAETFTVPVLDLVDGELVPRMKKRFNYETISHTDEHGEIHDAKKKAVKFRVVNCCRNRIAKGVDPEVWYSKKSERASLHKVQQCGSVWTCPTCSRKINLKRQDAIAKAYELILVKPDDKLDPNARSGDAMLITFTVKHGRNDALEATLDGLKAADRYMQQQRAFRQWMSVHATGFIGTITATEMNYGQSNGWHPHLHTLWFFDRKLSEIEIEFFRASLFEAWSKACVANGFEPPQPFTPDQAMDLNRVAGRGLGVDVRRALSVQEYLTKTGIIKKEESRMSTTEERQGRKWSVEREMASSHAKKAKRAGRSPFQLLSDSMDGDQHAGILFQEYAYATLGKRQLRFSPKLCKYLEKLGYKDHLQSDEELAAELSESDSDLLGQLSEVDFDTLCNADKMGEQNPFGQFLFICKNGGFDAAIRWITDIRKNPLRKSGKKPRRDPAKKSP